MPNHYKAYAVILFIGAVSYLILFGFSRRLKYEQDLKALFIWCFATTSIAFLTGNYWILFSATLILLVYTRSRRSLDFQIALYFFLLLSLPTLRMKVPGFAGIQYLFTISWPSLLSIALLGPLIFSLNRSHSEKKIRATGVDKLVLVYFIYQSIFLFRDTSVTNGFRDIFELFIGFYLPYIVVSRCVQTEEGLIRIGHAIYIIIFFMALIGIFSWFSYWQLYHSVQKELLGSALKSGGYLARGGELRAGAVFGPIHFGTMIGIAMGFMISFFQRHLVPLRLIALHMIVLLTGLLVTYSRGPWVGVAVMLLVILALAGNKGKLILRLALLSIPPIALLLVTDFGATVVNLLPFIGSEYSGNVSYRQNLFFVGIEQINENPLFGSTNYLQSPRMQELIQGEGIIDLVNTYIQIGLNYGYIGIGLFCAIILGLIRSMMSLRKQLERKNLLGLKEQGVVLISVCVLIATVIATVSSVGNKQLTAIMWSVFGLCMAYVRISRKKITITNEQKTSDSH